MNKVNCSEIEKYFQLFIEGKLSKNDKKIINNHINNCPDCKKENIWESITSSWEKLSDWKEIEPSNNFMAKIQHQIVLEEEKVIKYWLKVDKIFSFAKAPIMAIIIAGIFFTNNNSFAYENKKVDIKNLKLNNPKTIKKIKKISKIKVIDILNKLNNISIKKEI